ncbi:hypothetical protein [Giesbergeria sinuosa]
MRRLHLLCTFAAITSMASAPALALNCYTVRDGGGKILHQSVRPPVDMSYPFSATIPPIFGPGASMVFAPLTGQDHCPEVDSDILLNEARYARHKAETEAQNQKALAEAQVRMQAQAQAQAEADARAMTQAAVAALEQAEAEAQRQLRQNREYFRPTIAAIRPSEATHNARPAFAWQAPPASSVQVQYQSSSRRTSGFRFGRRR